MKRKLVKNWFIGYFNKSKELHQEDDKPSVVNFDGYITFCENGKLHRKDKPSRISLDGSLEYFEDDKRIKKIPR